MYLFCNIKIMLDLLKNKSIGIANSFGLLISSIHQNLMPQANVLFPFLPSFTD